MKNKLEDGRTKIYNCEVLLIIGCREDIKSNIVNKLTGNEQLKFFILHSSFLLL